MSADNLGLSTVVIDAGHGGKDAGCVSADNKTLEKTITLDIALTLADKIRTAYPDVKVVLTRSKDVYVTLNDRAECANKANADLFISIHVNANPKSTPNGYSVHVLGQSSDKNRDLFAGNMEVCRRENSVILLEDDYKTAYQGFDPNDPESYIFMLLMQNSHLEQSIRFAQVVEKNLSGCCFKTDRGVSQDPFFVLWKTAMPSVLVELGFMSNPSDLARLRQKASRDDLAERLFRSFSEYKKIYDASLGSGHDPAVDAGKDTVNDAGDRGGAKAVYAIQIFATGKLLDRKAPEFMGFEPKIIKVGNLYKYYISLSDTEKGARENLAKVRKKYGDAFMVRIEGESVTRL